MKNKSIQEDECIARQDDGWKSVLETIKKIIREMVEKHSQSQENDGSQ